MIYRVDTDSCKINDLASVVRDSLQMKGVKISRPFFFYHRVIRLVLVVVAFGLIKERNITFEFSKTIFGRVIE